jgi:hypothetical protein
MPQISMAIKLSAQNHELKKGKNAILPHFSENYRFAFSQFPGLGFGKETQKFNGQQEPYLYLILILSFLIFN